MCKVLLFLYDSARKCGTSILQFGPRLAPIDGGDLVVPHDRSTLEINAMKTTLFVLCLLCTTAAFGQVGGTAILSNSLQFTNHAQRASATGMAQQQDLWGYSSEVVSAQGERPVGEVVPEKYEMPLGDAARIQRAQHASVKKALVVWENKAWGPGVTPSPAR